MACKSCKEARAKLMAGYPGAAAAEAARVLWWKARRGFVDTPQPETPPGEPAEQERQRYMAELNVAKSLPPFGSQPDEDIIDGRS